MTVQAASGAEDEALAGYRDLIRYWERTGGWVQQWATLRNLADLLERLGDAEPAALLRAAADGGDGRGAVLELAREAIDRRLLAVR